jgi:hypothetical protein
VGSWDDWDEPDDEKEREAAARRYTPAEAAADLARYYSLKRTVCVRTLVLVLVVGLPVLPWLRIPALALIAGGVCGVANMLLTMRSTEQVVDSRKTGFFVISSFLRIAVFGIVPVAFAAAGPWWSMAGYFAGFFLPLALYAAIVGRTFRRE